MGENVRFLLGSVVHADDRGKISIGPNSTICRYAMVQSAGGNIHIGSNCSVGDFFVICIRAGRTDNRRRRDDRVRCPDYSEFSQQRRRQYTDQQTRMHVQRHNRRRRYVGWHKCSDFGWCDYWSRSNYCRRRCRDVMFRILKLSAEYPPVTSTIEQHPVIKMGRE